MLEKEYLHIKIVVASGRQGRGQDWGKGLWGKLAFDFMFYFLYISEAKQREKTSAYFGCWEDILVFVLLWLLKMNHVLY